MKTQVWIAYAPHIFREALTSSLSHIDEVEIVENHSDNVDIAIFRLAETGQLQDFFRHKSLPNAKMIVFSPRGDHAFIRLPGQSSWNDVRPFGMDQLVAEIQIGRENCVCGEDQVVINQDTSSLKYVHK